MTECGGRYKVGNIFYNEVLKGYPPANVARRTRAKRQRHLPGPMVIDKLMEGVTLWLTNIFLLQ
ncbi:hypothetical protein KVMX100_20219 [Klebsiella variicola]|nr:hypothetical protein KVMX100_20219 [Klebsiella variicola]